MLTFRGRRSTLCGFPGVEVRFSWQGQGIVRMRGVTEVTVRGRRSTLCALFVAGAGNREVVSCGRGECRCHIGIGV